MVPFTWIRVCSILRQSASLFGIKSVLFVYKLCCSKFRESPVCLREHCTLASIYLSHCPVIVTSIVSISAMQSKPLEPEPKLSAFSPLPAKEISQLEKALADAEAKAKEETAKLFDRLDEREVARIRMDLAATEFNDADAAYERSIVTERMAQDAVKAARTALDDSKKRKRENNV